MKFFLRFALLFFTLPAFSANVRLYFQSRTNETVLLTNTVKATPVSGNILANGMPIPRGIPFNITFPSSGVTTQYFAAGFYSLTNSLLGNSGLVINVTDNGQTVYDLTNVLWSGYNTYVAIAGTNSGGITSADATNAAYGVIASEGVLTNNRTALVSLGSVSLSSTLGVTGTASFSGDVQLPGGSGSDVIRQNGSMQLANGLLTVDTGGNVTAQSFSGAGSDLTGLSGTAISSGTVADARIASTIARDSEVPAIMATNIAAASTNAQYAAYSNFRLNLQTNAPRRLIMDDDGEDIDGLIQHAALLKLMDYGEVELLAITKANTNEFSVGAVEVVNRFYGYGKIPIGVRRDGISYSHTMSWETNIVRYNTNLCTYLYNSNAPNAVVLMRKILANSPDNSVDFLVGGQSFNIYALFNSTADSISSKTGAELIFTKARDFYVIAGDYPTGVGDHNFATSPSTAQVWHWIGTTNSANRVIYVTISPGTGTATGGNYVNRPPYDPLYQSATNYIQAIGGSLPRPAWGAQGVLAAVRGTNQFYAGKRVFSFSAAGTNAINISNGNNTFSTGSGNQFYLTSTLTTGEWDSYVNGLFDQVPMITQAGATVRRDGDKMTGKLEIGVSSTNALSVGTNTLIVDTVTNKVMIGEARDGVNNPIINARVEIVGSNATATVESEPMLQLSHSTGAGVSFAQGARFSLGRYKTPTTFSGNSILHFEIKTDNSSLLGNGATWSKVMSLQGDDLTLVAQGKIRIESTGVPAIAPSGNQIIMWNSNKVLYAVTTTKTNLVSDGR